MDDNTDLHETEQTTENFEDVLPWFFTVDWIRENLNLTNRDRREVSRELAKKYSFWPKEKLNEQEFIQAYYDTTCKTLILPGVVESIIEDKYGRKGARKGLSPHVYFEMFNQLKNEDEPINDSWRPHDFREALFRNYKTDFLTKVLWLDICRFVDIENAIEWVRYDIEISFVLGGFVDAFEELLEGGKSSQHQEISDDIPPDDTLNASSEPKKTEASGEMSWDGVLNEISALVDEAPSTPDCDHAELLAKAANKLLKVVETHEKRKQEQEAEEGRKRAERVSARIDESVAALPRRKRAQELQAALEQVRVAVDAVNRLDAATADEINRGLDRASGFAQKIADTASEATAAARAYADAEGDDEEIEQRLDTARANQREVEGQADAEVDALHALAALPGTSSTTSGHDTTGTETQEEKSVPTEPVTPETEASSQTQGRESAEAPPTTEDAPDTAEPAGDDADPQPEPTERPTPETEPVDFGTEDADTETRDTRQAEPLTTVDPATEEPTDASTQPDDGLDATLPASLQTLMTRGEYGFAYHLTYCADHLGIATRRLPLPATLELFNIGRTVRGSGSQAPLACWPLVQQLSADLADVDNETERGLASIALAFAGALRPALFAPESGARQLIEQLPIGTQLQFLHPVREAIKDLDRHGLYTTASRLRGAGDPGPAREAYDAALKDLEAWIEQTRQSNIVYAPATKVWRALMSPEGEIGSVVEAIRAGASDARTRTSELVRKLSDAAEIEALIQETDETLRPEVAGKRIEARAMDKLRLNAEKAAGKINTWIEADTALDNDGSGEDRAEYEHLLEAIGQAREQANELSHSGSPVADAAAAGLRQVFDTLRALMNGADDQAPLTHQFALHADLLKLSGTRYVGGWTPTPYEPEAILDAIARAAENDSVDWLQAFRDRVSEANHLATAHLVEIVRRLPEPPGDPATLDQERDQAVHEARTRLHERRDTVRRDLDRAMRLDQSEDMQLSDLIDRIDAVDPDALPQEERLRDADGTTSSPIADFPAAFRLLDQAEATIRNTAEGAKRQYLDRIAALEAKGGNAATQAPRLRDLLDQGDLLTLAEYIETVERGSALPEVDTRGDVFDSFFPGFVQALDAEKPQFAELVKAARAGRDHGSVTFGQLREERRDDAASILVSWSSLKKNAFKSTPKETLGQLFEALGFRQINLTEDSSTRSANRTRRFTLKTQPIADQTVCPVPMFGSKAGGYYDLMIYAGQVSVDEIIRDADKVGPHPRIAIILGRMSEAQRRTFAREAHRQQRSVLLIDEAMLLFLVLHEGYRLAALFGIALPFAWSDPYTTTAGNIPIEIFYGRNQEIDKIRNPEGPSLVFGGRQLGKSALLQHVAKLDHAPEQGYVVRVLDCWKIGRSEPTNAIWPRISNDLATLNVVDSKLTDGHQIADQIMAWLDADPRRRLLICLDEMDGFMLKEVEANYEHLVIMKELMQRSQWRCKFVFAGLHDIQRMAKTVNTPLAHLGEPICVGPLYGDDLAAAHELVTRPMAAAGYSFESEALPLRILADVLYYPSLVQVYCKQLLEHLGEAQFSEQEGPRYIITADQVESAFAGEQLRYQLAHRFDLTLRLDQRYRLIALILTQQAFDDRHRDVDGYSLQWIRDEALSWWPQGFPSTSNDAFRTLLDEMTGLGVLYKRNAGWRLRSTKIASMIGSPEQIEQDLLEFEHKKAEMAYEPAVYHRGIDDAPFRPSPLTQRQEYDLVDDKVGVSLILGSRLQGINEVIPAIESAEPPMPIEHLGPTTDIRAFGNAVNKADKRRGTTVIMVGPDQPWTVDWVRGALRHSAIRKRKVRVIFLGGSEAALNWTESGLDTEDGRKLQVLPLRPWTDQGIKLWLHDTNLDTLDKPDERARILNETGGYTGLISSFGTLLHNLPRDWRQRRDRWFDEVGYQMATHEALGIQPGMAPFVRTLADLGETDIRREEIAELPGLYGFDMPVTIDIAMTWCEILGFAMASGRERWQVNPLLPRIAATTPETV